MIQAKKITTHVKRINKPSICIALFSLYVLPRTVFVPVERGNL